MTTDAINPYRDIATLLGRLLEERIACEPPRQSRIPQKVEWSEAGNTLFRTGSIIRTTTPLHLWLLDRWLRTADELVHSIDRRLPHDERGWTLIDHLSAGWGNPICAAYLYFWNTWYAKQQREFWIEVKFGQLSPETQRSLLKMNRELDAE